MTIKHFDFNMKPDETDGSTIDASLYLEFLDDDGYIITAITLGGFQLAFEEYSNMLKTLSDYYLEETSCLFAVKATDLAVSRYNFELLSDIINNDEEHESYTLFKIPFNTLKISEHIFN